MGSGFQTMDYKRGMRNRVDEDIRICMLYEFRLGSGVKEAYQRLSEVYGPSKISYNTVCWWFAKFHSGDLSLRDDEDPMKLVNENVLETLMKQDPQMSRSELAEIFDVHHSTLSYHVKKIRSAREKKPRVKVPKKVVEEKAKKIIYKTSLLRSVSSLIPRRHVSRRPIPIERVQMSRNFYNGLETVVGNVQQFRPPDLAVTKAGVPSRPGQNN
ncbi:hypothetical protein Q1695_016325 [Nippostrongylus brasiliensis]|nr:hypothetical protein Q1695_016325 [Nippostrongylus brasiliensis]